MKYKVTFACTGNSCRAGQNFREATFFLLGLFSPVFVKMDFVNHEKHKNRAYQALH